MAFFNDFKELFSSAAQSVSSKTRDSVENARLAGESRSTANELANVYEQLGRLYVDSEGSDSAGLTALCARALGLREKLEQLEKQRMQLRSQNRCPACGAVSAKDARFCASCGRRMPEAAPEAEPVPAVENVRYCEKCGAMLKDGDAFCALCGFGGEEEPEADKPEVFEVKMVRPKPIAVDDGDEAPDDFEAD